MSGRVIVGVILLVLGVGFLAQVFTDYDFGSFLADWWPLILVFVGGIVLSMLFLLGQGSFDWQNLLFAGILLLVPVLVFFLNMRDTHRVLAAEKERELEAVQQRILQACRTLMERMGADESSGTLAAEINALVAYEARLLEARTWPYNTAMLRTLFFSAVIPGGAALARVASEVLFK